MTRWVFDGVMLPDGDAAQVEFGSGPAERLHRPVSADELLDAVVAEIDDGAEWIKLIGDFPATEGITVVRGSAVEPTYPPELVRAVVEAAHARGARVAAHTNSRAVGDLVAAGVDSIEHGTALEPGDIEALAERGGAWTRTLCASVVAGPGETDEARTRRRARSQHLAAVLPVAVAKGVRVLTGSDVVGDVVSEVRLLVGSTSASPPRTIW